MTKTIGLALAVMACFMSYAMIQFIDKEDVNASMYALLMLLMLAGMSYICLTSKNRKEDKK